MAIDQDIGIQNSSQKEFQNLLEKDFKGRELKENQIISQSKSISALSLYWIFLLFVWLIFFFTIYLFNDSFIAWCKSLIT